MALLRVLYFPTFYLPVVMFTLPACIVVFVFLSLWVLRRAILLRKASQDDVQELPSPPFCSWIFGHELIIWQRQASELYTEWAAHLGCMFRINGAFGHPDIIIAADHLAVQHIFQFTDNYVKSPAFMPVISTMLGRGVVWAEGENHRKQRRLVAPAFTAEVVKNMADEIAQCAEKMETRLIDLISLQAAGGAIINIMQYTSICTLDVIGRVAFGHDFQSGESQDSIDIRGSWHRAVKFGLTFSGFVAPLVLRTFPLLTNLLLTTQGQVKKLVSKISIGIIERGHSNDEKRDVLSLLLQANEKFGENLTTQQIVDNITTFTLVGHETSSTVLAYTIYDLARHPDKQQKLRDEIFRSGGEISYDGIQQLHYLDAVVKEGLRLHPSAPRAERVALQDDVIPLKKPFTNSQGISTYCLRVKAGQVFHIPLITMNVDTKVWGKNAADFYPERWITPGGVPALRDLPHGWNGMMTFVDGPRVCLGYRLAVYELKVILATIIRSLEFNVTEANIKTMLSQTLQPVADGEGGVLPLNVTLASGA